MIAADRDIDGLIDVRACRVVVRVHVVGIYCRSPHPAYLDEGGCATPNTRASILASWDTLLLLEESGAAQCVAPPLACALGVYQTRVVISDLRLLHGL